MKSLNPKKMFCKRLVIFAITVTMCLSALSVFPTTLAGNQSIEITLTVPSYEIIEIEDEVTEIINLEDDTYEVINRSDERYTVISIEDEEYEIINLEEI